MNQAMKEQTSLPYFIQPWPHQQEIIDICRNRSSYLLRCEMGTGKTAATINILREKCYQHGRVLKTLIICPKSVVYNWQKEIAAHAGKGIVGATEVLTGSQTQRIETLRSSKKKIFITNTESVNMKNLYAEVCKFKPDCLIVDESHRFKNPEARRTKSLISLADLVKYKFILTGTPILNSLSDIWAQLRILSPHIVDNNFYAFRKKYFYDKNAWMKADPKMKGKHWPDWQIAPGKVSELQSIIEKNSYSVLKKDVLKDLPPITYKTLEVELTPEQKKHYRSMESLLATALHDSVCSTNNALTQLLRLQQICSGVLKTDDGISRKIKSAKLDLLKDLLEDICPQNKAIVWTNFTDTYADIANLCDDLGLSFTSITGNQSTRDRQQAIDDFNTLDNISVCIANQAAGGVGIGLQAASYMIYYSKNYNLEQDAQSEARAHRGGSEVHEKITRIDLVARQTVEEEITKALIEKQELSDLLLNIKKKYE